MATPTTCWTIKRVTHYCAATKDAPAGDYIRGRDGKIVAVASKAAAARIVEVLEPKITMHTLADSKTIKRASLGPYRKTDYLPRRIRYAPDKVHLVDGEHQAIRILYA